MTANNEPPTRIITVLPHSEVCIHMRVAGKLAAVEPRPNNMAQIFIDGHRFSFPVTASEAGIRRNADGEWEAS